VCCRHGGYPAGPVDEG